MKRIRKEVLYPHPPERVWRAITDSRILAMWFMPSDIAPVVGHRFRFQTTPAPGFDGIVHCEVVEADAPRRFAYTWAGGPIRKKSTLVEWTLIPEDQGTRVILEHSGFEGLAGLMLRTMLGRGWGHKMREPRHLLAALNKLAIDEKDETPASV